MKERIFFGPRMREVTHDPDFGCNLSCTAKEVWNIFKSFCTSFIGIHKAKNYTEIVSEVSKC
jgi:hypothetical protein